jgi:hypothetical protein
MVTAKNGWYRAARWFAWTLIISLAAIAVTTYLGIAAEDAQYGPPPPGGEGGPTAYPSSWLVASDVPLYALLVSMGAFCVSAIGTASTVILGWRNERRIAAESKLKIEQLEMQLTEARRQAGSNA